MHPSTIACLLSWEIYSKYENVLNVNEKDWSLLRILKKNQTEFSRFYFGNFMTIFCRTKIFPCLYSPPPHPPKKRETRKSLERKVFLSILKALKNKIKYTIFISGRFQFYNLSNCLRFISNHYRIFGQKCCSWNIGEQFMAATFFLFVRNFNEKLTSNDLAF